MTDDRTSHIKSAVNDWARQAFSNDEIIIGSATLDAFDEDEAERYLVDFAVRPVGRWSVAEVWVSDGRILAINDIGEGLPLNNAEWPWPSD
jgi:hypothetical protein